MASFREYNNSDETEESGGFYPSDDPFSESDGNSNSFGTDDAQNEEEVLFSTCWLFLVVICYDREDSLVREIV